MKSLSVFILFFVIIICTKCFEGESDLVVSTTQGRVRGHKALDGDYYKFLGISYARVDPDNPFGANLPAEMLTETFDANDGSSECPQTDFAAGYKYIGSLDCLKLNIYVPTTASTNNRLPVLVWIHGGGFVFGSAGEYNGRDLVRHDIIVVTINYRLGPYGFLCLDVPTVPGNQGLKDQLSALLWIRDNIERFGGDLHKITIGGQSAGAASVEYHIFSPYERLYNKVIMQSGTAEHLVKERDERDAIKLAAQLGVFVEDTYSALKFLNTVTPALVINATFQLGMVFETRPCIEKTFRGVDAFVTTDPFSFYAPDKFENIPVLTGHTDKELFSVFGLPLPGGVDLGDFFRSEIESYFNLDEEQIGEASNAVRHFYVGDKSLSGEINLEMEAFYSDYSFNHPTQRAMTKYLRQGASPVYQYVFNYIGRSPLQNLPGVGASHSDELNYLFAYDNVQEPSEEDVILTDRITTLWANFVKYGNPTPQETPLIPFTLEPATLTSRPYLNIDTDLSLGGRIYHDRMAFWDLFYKQYGRYHKLIRNSEVAIRPTLTLYLLLCTLFYTKLLSYVLT